MFISRKMGVLLLLIATLVGSRMAMLGGGVASWCDHDDHNCDDRHDVHGDEDSEQHAHTHSHGPFEHSHDAAPCRYNHDHDFSAVVNRPADRKTEIPSPMQAEKHSPDAFACCGAFKKFRAAPSTGPPQRGIPPKFSLRATRLVTECWLS